MIDTNQIILIIILNVNGLNILIKRWRLIGLDKTSLSYICGKKHIKYKDSCMLKVKQWKKIYHANIRQKKSGVAIFISK